MADTVQNPTAAMIRDKITFHDQLNPKVWEGAEMRPEVRLRLMRGAMAFYKFLGIEGLRLRDIYLTGSNAAYNYTTMSDLDVHLVVDFGGVDCPDLAENLFKAKKALWGDTYEATVRGLPLEFYVEDSASPATSNGVYSILRGEWVNRPDRKEPHPDDKAVIRKTEALADAIKRLLATSPTVQSIDGAFAHLHSMRRAGLEAGGEFSTENLTYKALRNLGLLDVLWDARVAAIEATLSLREVR